MSNRKIKIGHIHVWDRDNKGDVAIVEAVQEWLSKIQSPVEIEDFPMEILQVLNEVNLERLNDCDLIVIGGGGIYYKYFLPFDTQNISRIQPPIVIFGVGYIREIGSDNIGEEGKQSLRELNLHASLSSVRDFRTKDFLQELGVPQDKIDVVGDPAIFLAEKKTDSVKFDEGRIAIGVNLNYSGWLGFGNYEDLIINSYNQIGNYFQKKFGAQIYYLQHHPGEEDVIKKLDIDGLEVIDLLPREQKYIYSRLDLIVGMMLHSAVLSFGAGTPFINLGYDIRNKSFGDFIGCPELVIGADELQENALVSKAIEVFEKKKDYKRKFVMRKGEILDSQMEFLDKINKVVDKI